MREFKLPKNPFVGLRPFESHESLLFFGRDDHVDALTKQLDLNRFLAVIGSSGSGKSSLVRAGLIPCLKAGFMVTDRSTWHIADMKPSDRPLQNLATALLKVLGQGQEQANVDNFLTLLQTFGVKAIDEYFTPLLDQSNGNLLLLVDQFEELFRSNLLTGSEEQREEATSFVSIMLDIAAKSKLSVYVVMTMRSDFLGDCDAFAGLPEAMNQSQYLVPRLTRAQRREVIEAPVQLYGRKISPRLVDRLLNDAGDESDQLPVLQHTLMRTWGHSENSTPISVENYKAIGEFQGALSQHAERALRDMTDDDKKLTQTIFRALTTTDESNRRIRRQTPLNDIVKIVNSDLKSVWKIIGKFRAGGKGSDGRSFLVVPSEDPKSNPLIDISHESLIRQWTTLGEWVDAEAESVKTYKRLAEDAAAGEEQISLWRGPQLDNTLKWEKKEEPNKAWAERYHEGFDDAIDFLHRSEAASKRTRRITISLIMFIFTVLVVSSILFKKEAERIGKELSSEKVIKEKAISDSISTYAAKLKEANEQKDSTITILNSVRLSLEKALVDTAKLAMVARNQANFAQTARAKAEDLQKQAEAARDSAKRSQQQVIAVALAIKAERQLQAGNIELAALLARQAYSFDQSSGSQFRDKVYNTLRSTLNALSENAGGPKTLPHNDGWVRTVAIDPEGRIVASGSEKSIKVWNLRENDPKGTLVGHTAGGHALAFLDSNRLVSAADDTIRIWDVSKRPVRLLSKQGKSVRALALNRNYPQLASGGANGKILIWDLPDGTIPTWMDHDSAIKNGGVEFQAGVNAVAFGSPESGLLASGHQDGTLRLWRIQGGQNTLQELHVEERIHENGINSLAFDSNGKTLASGGQDTTLVLWNILWNQGRLEKQSEYRHDGPVNSVQFSPVAHVLASASSDRKVRLWDLASPDTSQIILRDDDSEESWIWSLAFSPDGKMLASGNRDTKVRLWNINTKDLADRACDLVKRKLTKKEWQEYVGKIDYEPACQETAISRRL